MSAASAVDAIFQSLGLSSAAAADLTGVLQSESGPALNTGSQNNSGTDASGVLSGSGGAFGIASWNGSRQTDLKNWAAQNNCDPSNLTCQARFVLAEMQTSVYAWVYNVLISPTSTQSDRINALVKGYEKPAASNVGPEEQRATNYSNQIQAGQPATAGSQLAPATGGTSVTGSNTTAAPATSAANCAWWNIPCQVSNGVTTAVSSSILPFFLRIGAAVVGVVFVLIALEILSSRGQSGGVVTQVVGKVGRTTEALAA